MSQTWPEQFNFVSFSSVLPGMIWVNSINPELSIIASGPWCGVCLHSVKALNRYSSIIREIDLWIPLASWFVQLRNGMWKGHTLSNSVSAPMTYFLFCTWVLCLHAIMYTTCVSGACRGQFPISNVKLSEMNFHYISHVKTIFKG